MNRTPVLLGRSTQVMPNNWKLYFENVKDTYHASILHLFLTTFRINRLSMPGGIYIDRQGGNHYSYAKLDYAAEDADYKAAALRADSEFQLQDRTVVESVDEYGDGVSVQILTIFPGMVLQQVRNTIAVRVICPRGVDKAELEWIHLGFDTDDEAMTERRLRQGNLIGAAGYISMEDGCVGGFVQRALQYNDDGAGIVMMGGHEAEFAELPRQRGGDPWLLETLSRADGRVMDLASGIHELIAEYCECIDEDRLEAWPELFADPCRYLVISRANHEAGLRQGVMYAASRGMLQDRVFSIRRANIFEPHRYRHVVGPIRLKGEEHGVAVVHAHFLCARIMHDGATTLFASGRYLDRIDVTATPFRFKERLVVLDSDKIDTLLAIPL